MTEDLLLPIAELQALYDERIAMLNARIIELDQANRLLRREVAEVIEALTPFADEPISTDVNFHRTRPLSLRKYDAMRRNARRVLGVPLEQTGE